MVGWTFRRENGFLPADFRVGADPAGIGNLAAEIDTFLDAGMDSFFTDNHDIGDQVVTSRATADPKPNLWLRGFWAAEGWRRLDAAVQTES